MDGLPQLFGTVPHRPDPTAGHDLFSTAPSHDAAQDVAGSGALRVDPGQRGPIARRRRVWPDPVASPWMTTLLSSVAVAPVVVDDLDRAVPVVRPRHRSRKAGRLRRLRRA